MRSGSRESIAGGAKLFYRSGSDGAGMITVAPPAWMPPAVLGDIETSPVVRGGRVYVANTLGDIYSIHADTGIPGPAFWWFQHRG